MKIRAKPTERRGRRGTTVHATMAAVALLAAPRHATAQYHYYNVAGGADGILQDYRSPNTPGGIYDAIHEEYVASSDAGSAYFYGGFTHQNVVNGSPRTLVQYVCWPASGGYAPLSQQIPVFAGTNMVWFAQIGEGSCCAIKGYWPQFTTNLWTREAVRYWQPTDGARHVGYQGMWIREPVSANWYHVGTLLYPFAVTGVNGMSGWQENFSGHTGPYIVDHGPGYYHKGGRWLAANQVSYTSAGHVSVINGGAATESQVANSALPNNVPATVTMTRQPAAPALDPIVVGAASASFLNSQVLVQWQMPESSSPQLSYRIEVFGNSAYSGTPAANLYEIEPDTRQRLLTVPGVTTPYVRLTITDIFDNSLAPILITPVPTTPTPAVPAPGAAPGLAYRYYESASGDWSSLPYFGVLTPVASGAVNFPDVTPRRRRSNYGFAFSGFINAPSDGLYAFTLHSGDGSRLVIDGVTVVDFDGLHDSTQFKGGGVALAAGPHAFDLQFFKGAANPVNTGALTDGLGLTYEGPGIAKTEVPASAWSRVPGVHEPAISMVSPTNGATAPDGGLALAVAVSPNGNQIGPIQFYITDYSSYYFRPNQGSDYYLGQTPASDPYRLNALVWSAPTNQIRARLTYNGKWTLDSAPVAFTSPNPSLAPWLWTPLEMHNYPSGATGQGDPITLLGDGMNLVSRKVTGDCTLVGRVAAITPNMGGPDGVGPGGNWRAGIVLRGTTNTTIGQPLGDGGATRFAALFNSVGGGAYFEDDTMRNGNGDANGWSGDLGGANHWFKLNRVGDTFTSTVSADGVHWTQVNSRSLPNFGATVYAGAFIHSEQSLNPNLHWARFDNLSLLGAKVAGPAGVFVNPATNTVVGGLPAVFSASVIGPFPNGYQWRFQGTNLPGATNATLVIPSAGPADAGAYTVTANGITSAPGVLILSTPPGSGVWTNVQGGSWGAGGNWSGGAPAGGSGAVADFSTLALKADPTVSLDGGRTLGALLVDDLGGGAGHDWTFSAGSGGPLTLASTGGTPAVVVRNGAATLSVEVDGSQGFEKYGPGVLALTGACTITGPIAVAAGTLEVHKKSGDTTYSVASGATLKIGYSTGGGYANTGISIAGGGADSLAGLHLLGGVHYNVEGGMILSGAPTVIRHEGAGVAGIGTFDINVNPGLSVTADASGSAVDANIQMISLGYGMVITTEPGANTGSGDLTLNGPLNVGSLGLFKRGAGSLALAAPAGAGNTAVNLQAGSLFCKASGALGTAAAVALSAGTQLSLGGFDQAAGSLVIPAGATLDFGGQSTFSLSSPPTLAGALRMLVAKGGAGSASRLVSSAGPLRFGGTLEVRSVGPASFAAGDTFTLFRAPSYAGAFAEVSLPALPPGLGWNTSALARTGSISIVTNTVTAYEPFGPTDGLQAKLPGARPTGVGFAGPWTQSTADPGSVSYFLRMADAGVFPQGWPGRGLLPAPGGGRVQLNDAAWSWTTLTRTLAAPLAMQTAGDWWASFLLHDNGNNNYSCQVFLEDSGAGRRLVFGHGYGGQLIAFGDTVTRPWQMAATAGLGAGQMPGCTGGNRILMVAQIHSDGLGRTTVSAKHYLFDPVAGTGPALETNPNAVVWDASLTVSSPATFDRLGLSGGGQNSLPEIAEIRIARAWNDVTGAPPTLPRVTSQPQSQIVTQGAAVTLAVVADGSPSPSFQWSRGSAPLGDGPEISGARISGANSNVLTLQNAQVADSGVYSAGLTNGAGGVASDGARLLVVPPAGDAQRSVFTNIGSAGGFHFTFKADAGYGHWLQWSTNLGPASNWITLSNLPPAFDDAWIGFTNGMTNPAGFYRAWIVNP